MNVCISQLLYFYRINVSEGIDVNKTRASKQYDICHYWYFLYYSLKFQPNVYNRCNDLLMMSMSLSNIANLNTKDSDYRCIIVINFILLVIYCLIFSVLYVTVNRH